MENNIDFQYTINNPDNINCIFELNASGTIWGNIVGNIANQTDLQEALNSKQDVLTAGDNIQITNGVISATDTTYTAGTGISIENGVISNTQISAIWGNIQGTLSNQTDLQNTLDLMNEQIEANHEEIGEIGQTIGTYGDIVTYNAANFATFSQGLLANTALQPNDNISELNNNVGYITSAALPTDYVPETRTINGYALTSNIILNYSDVGALSSSTTINNLTTTSQLNALNSGATTTNIGQIATNTSDIADINALIPAQATTSNQLADKDFVNSSIATNTAYFIGTFNSVAELEAYSGTLTNNDYAFVATTDSAGNTLYDRYKYNADTQQWIFEYELNNSSFTAQQWASINSGITSGDVTLIGTALQPNDNITQLTNNAGYITNSVNNLVNYTLSSSLSTVATSGSYNDLLNKPTIPTVNNNTITFTQGGVTKGSFTLNQSSNATIALDAGGGTVDQTYDGTSPNAQSGVAIEGELTNYQKKLTAGDNIEIGNIEVPSGYTQLEYIESDGTGYRYLDSGIVPNTFDYEITTIAKFNSAPTGTNVYTMWGYKDLAVTNNGYRWDLSAYQQKFNFGINEENTINAFDTNKHTFISKIYEDNGQYLYSSQIDDIVYMQDATINNPTNITNNTLSIYLFARYNYYNRPEVGSYVDGRIYRHTVKKSGTIIQDLVPAKRNSDNTIGMYDLIAGTFLTFTGRPFIAGANAPIINFVNNSGYITNSALSGYATETWVGNQGYQTTSNLVTSISSSSTDAQYPSAKCVYDIVGDIESILHNINSGS